MWELLSRVKSARDYFSCLLALVLLGGLAQPSTDRKPAKVSWSRQDGQEETGKSSSQKKRQISKPWYTCQEGAGGFGRRVVPIPFVSAENAQSVRSDWSCTFWQQETKRVPVVVSFPDLGDLRRQGYPKKPSLGRRR